MHRTKLIVCGLAAVLAAPTMAQAPMPTQNQPYLFMAGQADVFEITTSQMAAMRSDSAEVRAFASMLIDHHTRTTNLALAAARAAGVPAPAPALDARQREMITQLMNAAVDDFDRIYLSQQVPAHEEALMLHRTYAANGDTAQLRTTAQGAVPIVESHLTRARAMLAGQ